MKVRTRNSSRSAGRTAETLAAGLKENAHGLWNLCLMDDRFVGQVIFAVARYGNRDELQITSALMRSPGTLHAAGIQTKYLY